ncbi:MAG: relaxase domain-containing protein [Candidatus Eisenbacteria bacterium]|nr:relaxase domain-containing protein [Candidatus Eisenbacteria bacterium]
MLRIAPVPKTDPFGYYSAEGPGTFEGTLAAVLGVDGCVVTRAAFQHLWDGRSPDGLRKLGRTRRFRAWDVVAIDPKSLPIYEVLHPESTLDIEAARRTASRAMLALLEERCAWARRGAGGTKLEKAVGLLTSRFPHKLSRALQPASHTHHILWSLTQRLDSSWGALPGIRSTRAARNRNGRHGSGHRSALYLAKREAGEVYQAVLRAELERHGYRTRDREGFGFELVGVSDRLMRHFSRRRPELLAHAERLRAEHGDRVPEQKLLVWAARGSRAEKPKDLSLPTLEARWREEARALERGVKLAPPTPSRERGRDR